MPSQHRGPGFSPSSTEKDNGTAAVYGNDGGTKYSKGNGNVTLRSKFMPRRLTCKYVTLLSPGSGFSSVSAAAGIGKGEVFRSAKRVVKVPH